MTSYFCRMTASSPSITYAASMLLLSARYAAYFCGAQTAITAMSETSSWTVCRIAGSTVTFSAISRRRTVFMAFSLPKAERIRRLAYWSWYGFNSRVEWCACFVSWCANECGYIDAGVIPKFAGCTGGSNWFKDRGQWQDGDYEPRPGDLIFFDWDNKGSSGPQDDVPDHVGIVERVENGVVYTVEGNTSDSCRQRSYSVGHYEIWGYGCPIYN